MTDEEMLNALGEVCDSFTNCTANGGCPLDGARCVLCQFHPTHEEIEIAYNKIFKKETPNPVTNPSHYTQGDIECIDAMVAAFGMEAVATWCKLNAFKYLWREQHKNGIQDIDKARWYLNKYMEFFKKE